MSRRRCAEKRDIRPDSKYGSVLISKFINKIMEQGKKAIAQKIVYGAFEEIEKKHNLNPLDIFNSAIQNVKPYLELNSVRIGGANYQVPCPVDEYRGHILAIRWLIESAKKRSERVMLSRLSAELIDAYNNRGSSIKKRDDTHKMAEANKAFAHFGHKRSKDNKPKN
jgi:small subunit ribosomal protein S7